MLRPPLWRPPTVRPRGIGFGWRVSAKQEGKGIYIVADFPSEEQIIE